MQKISYLIFAWMALMTTLMALMTTFASAQELHKVVLAVNTDEMKTHARVITNITNLTSYYGAENLMIEVVAYGPGIWFLTDKSRQSEKVVDWAKKSHVQFSACENTMNKIEQRTGKKPILLEGVQTVPGGIIRIIELQEQGYAYVAP